MGRNRHVVLSDAEYEKLLKVKERLKDDKRYSWIKPIPTGAVISFLVENYLEKASARAYLSQVKKG